MQVAHGDLVDHPLQLVPVEERDPPGLLDRREQALCTGMRSRARRPAAGTLYQASPVPWRIARRWRASSSSNGRSRSIPIGLGHRLDHPGEERVLGEVRARRRRPRRGGFEPGRGSARRGRRPCWTPRPSHDGAPAERAVEREVVRRKLLEAPAAAVAGPVLAVAVDGPFRPRRRRRRRARRGSRPCPGRAPPRPSRPAANGSHAGRSRGRRPPRPGACGAG